MKIILDGRPDRVLVCGPTAWVMRAMTQGGIRELAGDVLTADLAENPEKRLAVARSMPYERARDNMIRNGRRPEFIDRYLAAMLEGGESDAGALELVREHAFRDRTGQIAAERAVLPKDRSFRNAWRLAGDRVVIDMPAARTIFARAFIHWRTQGMIELGKQIESNLIAGTVDDQIEAQFEALRALNLQAMGDKVIAARTPEELKALCPECLP